MPCRGEIPLRSEPDRDEGRQRNDGGGHRRTSRNPSTGIGAAADPASGSSSMGNPVGPKPREAKLRPGSRVKPVGKDDVGSQACGPS